MKPPPNSLSRAAFTRFVLAAGALFVCVLHSPGQTRPSIASQPANQTASAGSAATFTVGVSGTGPFTYQWRFNGTNLPILITTIAGDGAAGYSGDGGPAIGAMLNRPYGVAVDGFGDVFIADEYNQRIREMNSHGFIFTVAGNGNAGDYGDGKPATNAGVYDPSSVAVDGFGNLFIGTQYNPGIREVGSNGIIRTVAGGYGPGYSGDGGQATNAKIQYPAGVAADGPGNFFIADCFNQRIRKVGTNGVITTVAGNGAAGYSGDGGFATNAALDDPRAIAVDALGDLFIADTANARIREVGTNGVISTVAGKGGNGYSGDGGAATNAALFYPTGAAVDCFGNLFIADADNNRIRMVGTNGIISTVAGGGHASYTGDGGAATNSVLSFPSGVAVDASGDLFIADQNNSRIREVGNYTAQRPVLLLANLGYGLGGSYDVVVSNSYGSVTSAVATLTVVGPPAIVASPASQTVPNGSNAMFSVNAAGTPPLLYSWYDNATNLVQNGTNNGLILAGITTNDAGNYTVVVSNAYGSVTSAPGLLTVAFAPSIGLQPSNQEVLVGNNAEFTVAANGTGPFHYQWLFNGTALPCSITTVAGTGIAGYSGDGGPAASAQLNAPQCVVVDGSGDLFIADTDNGCIREVLANGVIATVAGVGSNAYFFGDGGAATNAAISYPGGVVLDGIGNILIADFSNNRVRKVNTNGIISTVAGNGALAYAGDGGPAAAAELKGPGAVTVDSLGNLFIADAGDQHVREVGTNGVIATVAGNGAGGDPLEGVPATNSGLFFPSGLAVDGFRNLFIADKWNQIIRKVGTNGIITNVAGTGAAGYAGDGGPAAQAELLNPFGVALDVFGNFFIADSGNNRIRKVETNGVISTIAGNGTNGCAGDGGNPANAELSGPSSVAVDAFGNVFIADQGNNRIREVVAQGTRLALTNMSSALAGDYQVIVTSPYGSITSAIASLTLLTPPSILVQPVSQVVLNSNQATFSVLAAGNPPPAYSWYDNGGNLLQTGTNNQLTLAGVTTINAGSYTVVVSNTYGSVTSTPAALDVVFPPSIAPQSTNRTILIGSQAVISAAVSGTGPFSYQWQLNGTNLPQIITTAAGDGISGFSGDGGAATNAHMKYILAVAADSSGDLLIADEGNNLIREVGQNGCISTVAGTGLVGYSGDGGPATNAEFDYPFGVAVDGSGNIFIADYGNHCIREVFANGLISTVAGNGTAGFSGDGGPATNAELNHPWGICMDSSGNLFIADEYNKRIREVGTNGVIITIAGNGTAGFAGDGGPATNAELNYPTGVAADGSGNIFIADQGNNRIRKVGANGVIATIAGNGAAGYSGDGQAAAAAKLNGPEAVAIGGLGELLIADNHNCCIREVARSGIITTVAGNGIAGYAGDGGPACSAEAQYPTGVTVDSCGNLFIADTYNYRVREVVAQGPTLVAPAVGPECAGVYSLVVTSPYASVTNLIVALNVAANSPQIVTDDGFFGMAASGFGFNVSAADGEVLAVDGSADMRNWTPLSTNLVSGNSFYFNDPGWTNYPWRFYRARLP